MRSMADVGIMRSPRCRICQHLRGWLKDIMAAQQEGQRNADAIRHIALVRISLRARRKTGSEGFGELRPAGQTDGSLQSAEPGRFADSLLPMAGLPRLVAPTGRIRKSRVTS